LERVVTEQSIGIHYNTSGELLDYVVNKQASAWSALHAPVYLPGLGVVIDEARVIERSRFRDRLAQPGVASDDGSVRSGDCGESRP